MPFTFSGSSPAGRVHVGIRRTNCAVVDVEHQHADAAVLDVVANAGLGDVEKPVHGCLGALRHAVWTCSGRQRQSAGEKQDGADGHATL